jgi:hypothetical protein
MGHILDCYDDLNTHTGHIIVVENYEGFSISLVCKTCAIDLANYDNKNI